MWKFICSFPQHVNHLGCQQALKFLHKAHSSHILWGSVWPHVFALEVLIAKISLIFVHSDFVSRTLQTQLPKASLIIFLKTHFHIYYSIPLFFFRNLTYLFKCTTIIIMIVNVFYSTPVTQ